eukprot:270554-Rhodomonas_salina.1
MLVDIENFKSNLHSYWLSVCRIHVESRCWLLMQSGIGSAMTMITNPPNVIIGQAFADQGMYLSCRNTRGARSDYEFVPGQRRARLSVDDAGMQPGRENPSSADQTCRSEPVLLHHTLNAVRAMFRDKRRCAMCTCAERLLFVTQACVGQFVLLGMKYMFPSIYLSEGVEIDFETLKRKYPI